VVPPPPPIQSEKHADRPHDVTVVLAIAAMIISIISLIFQEYNSVISRKEAALAAEKQAADVEPSRQAAELSAGAAQTLADTTQRALELQIRGTAAAERSAQAASLLTQEERGIRELNARIQSPRLNVVLQPSKDVKSGADSRKLYVINGSRVPALQVEIGYTIHTLGMSDSWDLAWNLRTNPDAMISESVSYYLKQIETLKTRYYKAWISPDMIDVVADELPAPKWFVVTMNKSDLEALQTGPRQYTKLSKWPGLRPAVVFGYVKYKDGTNHNKKFPFCMTLARIMHEAQPGSGVGAESG
jgi:hypothetical protein